MAFRLLKFAVAARARWRLPAAPAATTLRVVPHSDLAILDPIWTTAYMSRNHGYMIYDTLFGPTRSQDQAADGRQATTMSADKLTWTFKLRNGLEFHDGKPVTGED